MEFADENNKLLKMAGSYTNFEKNPTKVEVPFKLNIAGIIVAIGFINFEDYSI